MYVRWTKNASKLMFYIKPNCNLKISDLFLRFQIFYWKFFTKTKFKAHLNAIINIQISKIIIIDMALTGVFIYFLGVYLKI